MSHKTKPSVSGKDGRQYGWVQVKPYRIDADFGSATHCQGFWIDPKNSI